MHIQGAIEEYLGCKRDSITHDSFTWYTYHLDTFAAWCIEHNIMYLEEVTHKTVQTSVSVHRGKSANTKHGYVQVVKGFLHWCSLDEEMGVKECTVKRIELPKAVQPEIEIYTEAQIMKLFHTCERMKHPHRNEAALHLLLDTGIRAAEMCYDGSRPEEETGLRMGNLSIERGDSFIRVMGKGRKTRTVGLGRETRLALQRYLNRERGHPASPYVFLAKGDDPWSVRMLQQFLKGLGEWAGIEHVHAHRFRHTFAVQQLMSGTSDLVLMRLLGHTTLESTKTYTRAMSDLQARKVAPSVVDLMKQKKPTSKR